MINAFNSNHDLIFALIFAVIVLLAATPKGYEFWQHVRKSHTDTKLKLEMLKMGWSANQIVRTLMSRCDPDSSSHQV